MSAGSIRERRHQAVHLADRETRPYGLMIELQGVPYATSNSAPEDRQHRPGDNGDQGDKLPNDGARPRRSPSLRTTSSGTQTCAWLCSAARPKTGEVKEWQSPSGPKSDPYAIVFAKARSGTTSRRQSEHHRALRPAKEKFQSWAIPGGGDIVRNMDVTPYGNPVTRQQPGQSASGW